MKFIAPLYIIVEKDDDSQALELYRDIADAIFNEFDVTKLIAPGLADIEPATEADLNA